MSTSVLPRFWGDLQDPRNTEDEAGAVSVPCRLHGGAYVEFSVTFDDSAHNALAMYMALWMGNLLDCCAILRSLVVNLGFSDQRLSNYFFESRLPMGTGERPACGELQEVFTEFADRSLRRDNTIAPTVHKIESLLLFRSLIENRDIKPGKHQTTCGVPETYLLQA